jgi:ABC-type polysaccharide/polyol phosphate transport system ATPase subunit
MKMTDHSGIQQASITLENVSLAYPRYARTKRSFREALLSLPKRLIGKGGDEPFWVYRDLSLSFNTGERVGLIGHNGAGKSTLLKLMTGVFTPQYGRVSITGRVSPLIELQTGMIIDLSGVENIRLLGALLGWSKARVEERIGPIIEFAGLEEFAHAPVRCYSVGMKTRLAFSVATDQMPEILLMDEVFAGGDKNFIPKATDRMLDFVDQSHLLVLASHRMELIRQITTRTIWLAHGKIIMDGPTDEVVAAYEAEGDQPKQISVVSELLKG